MTRYSILLGCLLASSGASAQTTEYLAEAAQHGCLLVRVDGSIVVGATLRHAAGSDAGMVRYLADGSLDATFGAGGRGVYRSYLYGLPVEVNSVVPSGDDVMLVSASLSSPATVPPRAGGVGWPRGSGPPIDAALILRVPSDGGFGHQFHASPNYRGSARAMVSQSTGRFIITGGDSIGAVNASGWDEGFLGYGWFVLPAGLDGAKPWIVAGDRIMVGGTKSVVRPGADATYLQTILQVVRYTANGALDRAYSGDGWGAIPLPGGLAASFKSFAVDRYGRAYFAGTAGAGLSYVARISSAGVPDPTFDGDGILLHREGGGAVVQADGKLLVLGGASGRVVRFNNDGTLDPSFGTNGVTTLTVPEWTVEAMDAAVLADGRVIIAGQATAPNRAAVFVARCLPSGAVDTTFGTAGYTVTTFAREPEPVFAAQAVPRPAVAVSEAAADAASLWSASPPHITLNAKATTEAEDTATATVTITNTSDVALSGITAEVVSPSTLSVGALSATTIESGASVTFSVTYRPALDEGGRRSGSVRVSAAGSAVPALTIGVAIYREIGTVTLSNVWGYESKPGHMAVTQSMHPRRGSIFDAPVPMIHVHYSGRGAGFPPGTLPAYHNSAVVEEEIFVSRPNDSKYTGPETWVALINNAWELSNAGFSAEYRQSTLTLYDDDLALSWVSIYEVLQGLPVTIRATPKPLSGDSTFVWKRSGRADISWGPELEIESAVLSDAGVYTVEEWVNGVREASRAITVRVYPYSWNRESALHVAAGLSATFTTPPQAGTGWRYRWIKTNEAFPAVAATGLANSSKYVGATTTTLTIRAVSGADISMYVCRAQHPDGRIVDMVHTLRVIPAESPMATSLQLPATTLGANYDFALPFANLGSTDFSNQPASFSATGLPLGLRCDAVTGHIVGRPLVAGSFFVTVSMTNLGGTSKAVSRLTVLPMPIGAVGSFTGLAARGGTENSELGGRIDISTAAAGTFSGTLRIGLASYPFSGFLTSTHLATQTVGSAVIARPRLSSLVFECTIDHEADAWAGTLKLAGAASGVAVSGWRQTWKTGHLVSAQLGAHNLVISPGASDESVPQGFGFANVSVVATGAVTLIGRTGDSALLVIISHMGPNGEVLVYHPSFGSVGSIMGTATIASDASHSITGALNWQKTASPAGTRSYAAAFGPVSMPINGGRYAPPASGVIVLGLPNGAGPNAKLTFADGSLDATTTNPNVSFRIDTLNRATFAPLASGFNPGNVSAWSLDVAKGLFSGRFTLADRRSAVFYGVLVPHTNQGWGSFTLPKLPTGTETVNTTKILSGSVVLSAP